jgi:hypothetical protein
MDPIGRCQLDLLGVGNLLPYLAQIKGFMAQTDTYIPTHVCVCVMHRVLRVVVSRVLSADQPTLITVSSVFSANETTARMRIAR